MTKFGVQLPNFSGFDPGDLFDHIAGLVTAAEEAGFDSVWVMDHFFQLPPLGGPDQPMLEAYTCSGRWPPAPGGGSLAPQSPAWPIANPAPRPRTSPPRTA